MTGSSSSSHQMGVISCMSYVVGCIIGSGIFITPSYVLSFTHSIGRSLFVWLACGLISLIGGISYIELATAIPQNGGDFAYQTYVGWKGLAFCFMWISAFFTYPASTSVQAVTFGQYLVQGMEPYIPIHNDIKHIVQHLIGVVLLIGCTFMNFFAIEKFASKFQICATIAKFAVLAIIVVTGGVNYFWLGKTEAWSEPMDPLPLQPGTFVMALYSGLWAFAGWDILNYGTPSVRNPKRTLPLALIVGLLLVTVCYVLVNASFFAVLGPNKMLTTEAVAADFAENALGPVAAVVPFATAILLLGTVNAEIFCSSRIIFEAARQKHLPPFLSAVNKETDSPRAALLAQLAVSLFMTFVSVETLINYVSFVMWAQKLATVIALLYMKIRRIPVDEGVLRVPIFVGILFFLILLVLVLIPLITEFAVTIVGIAIVSAGLVVYYFFVKRNFGLKFCRPVSDCATTFTRIVLKATIAEEDEKEGEEMKEKEIPKKKSSMANGDVEEALLSKEKKKEEEDS